jgi:hypothetical protein
MPPPTAEANDKQFKCRACTVINEWSEGPTCRICGTKTREKPPKEFNPRWIAMQEAKELEAMKGDGIYVGTAKEVISRFFKEVRAVEKHNEITKFSDEMQEVKFTPEKENYFAQLILDVGPEILGDSKSQTSKEEKSKLTEENLDWCGNHFEKLCELATGSASVQQIMTTWYNRNWLSRSQIVQKITLLADGLQQLAKIGIQYIKGGHAWAARGVLHLVNPGSVLYQTERIRLKTQILASFGIDTRDEVGAKNIIIGIQLIREMR